MNNNITQMKNIEKRVMGKNGDEIVVNISESGEIRLQKNKIVRSEYRMEDVEIGEDEEVILRGYAAVYNSDSENMGGFYEQIAPGAFRDVMGDDVRAYLNHDENRLLGRVSSGTLTISSDDRGLYYEVKMPNTTYAKDLIELMKRGDINQSSFAFLIGDDYWEERNGETYRIITKISRLLDVSPVAQPAYPDATSEITTRDLETEPEVKVEAVAPIEVAPVEAEIKEDDSNIYLYKSKILNL